MTKASRGWVPNRTSRIKGAHSNTVKKMMQLLPSRITDTWMNKSISPLTSITSSKSKNLKPILSITSIKTAAIMNQWTKE
jgi:hypothetical protein